MAILLAVCAAGRVQAGAPTKGPGAPLDLPLDDDVTPSSLDTVPTNDDLQREYPRLALMMGLGGKAVMTCLATPEGRLDDCHVDSEEPAGLGFGAATVRAASYFRVTPARRAGQPVKASITIPMRWQTYQPERAPPIAEAQLPPVSPESLSLARQALALQDMRARTLATWQPWLDQQSAHLVEVDDVQSGQHALDALHMALAETVDEETERSAHVLAANTKEADLRATVAFLESPAGRAWTAADAKLQQDKRSDHMMARIAAAARVHLCEASGCPGSSPAKSAAR